MLIGYLCQTQFHTSIFESQIYCIEENFKNKYENSTSIYLKIFDERRLLKSFRSENKRKRIMTHSENSYSYFPYVRMGSMSRHL